jgi:hypothetical protein
VALEIENYLEFKADGVILRGTQSSPQATIPEYNSRTGVRKADIVDTIDVVALNFWITFYQDKLNNLLALRNDIQTLPTSLTSTSR